MMQQHSSFFSRYAAIFYALISIVMLSFPLVNGFAQVNIDRVQRVYSPNPVRVPADRDGAFRVYFPYINPDTTPMDNVVAEIRIEGNGFVFVPEETYDYYVPDSNVTVDCKKLSDIPSHKISVPLASNSSVVYGLQTAVSLDKGSGDTVGSLAAGASGCIRATLAVEPSVIVGQTATVYMNWYIQGEADTNKQPPIGIYNLIAIKGQNTVEECLVDEELNDGICVKICRIGQIRDSLGMCVDQSTLNSLTVAENNSEINSIKEKFDIYSWLITVFSTALIISLISLIYSIILYRRLFP